MLQVKFIYGTDKPTLNEALNLFLSQVQSDKTPVIKYDLAELMAIVEYEKEEPYKKSICCECQNWQENGPSSLVGICQSKGQRKRFDCRACASWVDFRK